MVSLIKLAWPHSDADGLKVFVGKTAGASGVRVGENSKGVWVAMGAAGVDVLLTLWAATVSATAVCVLPNACSVASAAVSAPQAVMSRDDITSETKRVYFIDLNIFSFRYLKFIILLNRNARFSRALYINDY
jgi:hypothetical protein